MLYFFLSYAREDDPEHIRRFFNDLSRNVRNLSGSGRDDQVGFLDEQSVQIGERWSEELSGALASCSCFVAMTSPRYFRRDYCGREWSAFSDRLAAYERRWHHSAPALLPVYWIPTDPLPDLAAQIQFANSALTSDAYIHYGLRQMLELKRYRDDYRTFVFEFARRIVSVAGLHKVPPDRRPSPVQQRPNAFAIPIGDRPPVRQTPPKPRPRGFVHFVVVAGNREEMTTVRDRLDYYGRCAREWAPYRPVLDDALVSYAADVATERLFDSEIGGIERLAERIDEARRRNEVVILLVDVWSTELANHSAALVEFDARDDPATAVMIPFNTSDTETIRDTTVLQAKVATVLRRTVTRRDRVMLCQNVPTPDQFGVDLEGILETAQNRIFQQGTINDQVPQPAVTGRPVLEGPAMGWDAT